ncbi:MAG: tRNA lysidine(34) synthetase TilS [Actinobacteria bacterium]|nr:MAG: tRNA lysidine(34) synthetase TilS [Actinomycetota bacterium]
MNGLNLEQKILTFIEGNSLIKDGDKVILAVSGGPDSVSLTLVLNALRQNLNIKLYIFHLDHQVRADSKKDRAFVKKLAKKFDIEFFAFSRNVESFSKRNKLTLQEGARQIRYDLLFDLAKKINADKIATGHQANDQVETFFLRLLRGAALTGLQSIPLKRDSIIRPLLEISRNEILQYLKEQKQEFLTDPSNIKPIYLRNRVRNELIPVIKKLNPTYQSVLLSNISLITEEEQLLDLLAKEISEEFFEKNKESISIKLNEFIGLNKSLKRRLLREAILKVKGNLRGIEYKHLQLTLENIDHFGFTLELPDNLLIYRDYKDLVITLKSAFKAKPIKKQTFNPEEEIEVKPIDLLLKTKKVKKCQFSQFITCLDYGKIKPPLTVRGRKPGDRFQPLGIKGTKKLQDFFVDLKVPRHQRDSIAIVEDSEKIIWVVGFEIDERVKVDEKTKSILRIEIG